MCGLEDAEFRGDSRHPVIALEGRTPGPDRNMSWVVSGNISCLFLTLSRKPNAISFRAN